MSLGGGSSGSGLDSSVVTQEVLFDFPKPVDKKTIYTIEELEEIKEERSYWITQARATALVTEKHASLLRKTLNTVCSKILQIILELRGNERACHTMYEQSFLFTKAAKASRLKMETLAASEEGAEAKSVELTELEAQHISAASTAEAKQEEAERYLEEQKAERDLLLGRFGKAIASKAGGKNDLVLSADLFAAASLSPTTAVAQPKVQEPSNGAMLALVNLYFRLAEEIGIRSQDRLDEEALGGMSASDLGQCIMDMLYDSYIDHVSLSTTRSAARNEHSAQWAQYILERLLPTVIDCMLVANVPFDLIESKMLTGLEGLVNCSKTKNQALAAERLKSAPRLDIKGLQTPNQRARMERYEHESKSEEDLNEHKDESDVTMHGARAPLTRREYDEEIDGIECVTDKHSPNLVFFKKSKSSFSADEVPESVLPISGSGSGSGGSKIPTASSYKHQFEELKKSVGTPTPNTPFYPPISPERSGITINSKYTKHPSRGGGGGGDGGTPFTPGPSAVLPYSVQIQTTNPVPCPIRFEIGTSVGTVWKKVEDMRNWHIQHPDQTLRYAKQVPAEAISTIIALATRFETMKDIETISADLLEAADDLAVIKIDHLVLNGRVLTLDRENFTSVDNPSILRAMYAMNQNRTQKAMHDDLVATLGLIQGLSRVKDCEGFENLEKAYASIVVYIGHVSSYLEAIKAEWHKLLPHLDHKTHVKGIDGFETKIPSLADMIIDNMPARDIRQVFRKLTEQSARKDILGDDVYDRHKFGNIKNMCASMVNLAASLMLQLKASDPLSIFAQVQTEKRSSGGGNPHFGRAPFQTKASALVVRPNNRPSHQAAGGNSEYAARRTDGKTFYVKPSIFRGRQGGTINAIGETDYDRHEDGSLTADGMRLQAQDEAEARYQEEEDNERAAFLMYQEEQLLDHRVEQLDEDVGKQADEQLNESEETLAAMSASGMRPALTNEQMKSQPCYIKANKSFCPGEADRTCLRKHDDKSMKDHFVLQQRQALAKYSAMYPGENSRDIDAAVRKGLQDEIDRTKVAFGAAKVRK